eukprot:Colp12_sorted_trinity150504_noHs@24609
MEHLPVLLFKPQGRDPEPHISSIYFDNEDMDLYYGRLLKTEGAQALRLRWYGSIPEEVFVERKTHHDNWTGEESVKERFAIKEKHVNDFLAGRWSILPKIEKMRTRKQKPERQLNEMAQLATEVQQSVLERRLVPTMRTYYKRTAFQLPTSNTVRISLDTDLTLVRESDRTGGHWKRNDVGVDFPFSHVHPSDIVRFPYAVLEVKLSLQGGEEPPEWIQSLINGPLVEEVPKFSKFIHGCSTILSDRVSLLPFWLHQMDVDIRKKAVDHSMFDSSRRVASANSVPALPAPKKKKEAAPVDTSNPLPVVLPKVYLANERTLIKWLHTSFYLSTLGLTIVNFGSTESLIPGMVLLGLTIIYMLYAVSRFFKRQIKIRDSAIGDWDDPIGIVLLGGTLFMALAAIVAFRVYELYF